MRNQPLHLYFRQNLYPFPCWPTIPAIANPPFLQPLFRGRNLYFLTVVVFGIYKKVYYCLRFNSNLASISSIFAYEEWEVVPDITRSCFCRIVKISFKECFPCNYGESAFYKFADSCNSINTNVVVCNTNRTLKGKFYRFLSYARSEQVKLLNYRKRSLICNLLAGPDKRFYDPFIFSCLEFYQEYQPIPLIQSCE